MGLNEALIAELKQESITTKKLLERCPEALFAWKPHAKSMSLSQLASHVAELPSFITIALNTPELDFGAGDYKPFVAETNQQLLEVFEKNLHSALDSLKSATDEQLFTLWKMRNGEQIYFEMPRIGVIRAVAINHIIHHRGQLSVYLRLQDVPIPSIYGPSADEPM